MRLGRSHGLRRVWAPLLAVATVAAFTVNWAPAAHAQVPVPKFLDVKGYATGQDIHVTALNSGGTQLADVEVGWAGSSVDATSSGLSKPILNEFGFGISCPPVADADVCKPNLAAKHSHARGSGIELGLGTTNPSNPDPNQLILANLAEAAAPKSSKDRQEIGPLPLSPVAWASTALGEAVANWNASPAVPGVCVLGDDISRGKGYVEDAQLLSAGEDNPDGSMQSPVVSTDYTADDNVSNTTARNYLVPTPGRPANFGLRSEVVQVIAPVSLLKTPGPQGQTSALTIRFLGQWKLQVTASGHPGGAKVFYGPGDVSPETPILQIINDNVAQTPLKFEDVFGPDAPLPGVIEVPGLVKISIAEGPRAIAKQGQNPVSGSKPTLAADGTKASAALDVARIELLGGIQGAGTIAVGHMEASAQVPAGGINCPIPVTKDVNPSRISIGAQPDTARVTFNVLNPYDCDLTNVTLTDRIRQKLGDPDFILTTSDPAADSPSMPTEALRTADVTWSLGTIPKGGKKVVTMDVKSSKNGGVLRDIAEANGKLANCKGAATAGINLANLALVGSSPAVDISIELARTGPESRRTTAIGAGVAAIAGAAALTMRRRRRPG